MRPHRLSLTAFGSFPGSETVDFDSLAESGLFLIHGPTGAGKTTVLDALCFALYGQVPGQRNSARSLRCDHAPAGTGPSVSLEVTLRGRLLRIRRSPSWQRPKLRGTGHTEEKAKVIVEERTGAAWHGLTTRADEAGDLVGGLLGMNADQFCQVAMLPQGDFARFLRASGDDRHKLLGRLFTVKTFTQAESWLADHRKRAWRDQQDLRRQVDYAVQRLAEAATDLTLASPSTEDHAAQPASSTGGHSGASPEDAGRETALPGPEDDPVEWAGALLATAHAAVLTTAERHAEAERAWRSAGARFEEASALAARQRRHAEALTLRRTLDERAEERAELQAILDDAARADRVVPLITAARHRAEAATKAATLAADALTRAHPLLPPPSGTPAAGSRAVTGPQVEWLAGLERQRRAESARLSELLTEEARLLVVRRDLGRVETELANLERDDEATTARLAELPHLLQEAETQLARARADAARIPAVEAVRDAAADLIEVDGKLARAAAELDDLAEREAEVAAAEAELPARVAEAAARLDGVRAEAAAIPAASAALDAARAALAAARRRDALAAELESASAHHQTLVDRAQGLRERWLDIRQARIEGMAAELARDLSDGLPCAVCGSDHHPHPASPTETAPSPDDELAAEREHEAALADREAAERTLASLESRLADAEDATGGLDAAEAETAAARAEDELARLHAIADREPALAAELERIEAERDTVRDRAREIGEALAAHRSHTTHLHAERARLRTRLATIHPPLEPPAPIPTEEAATVTHDGLTVPSSEAEAVEGADSPAPSAEAEAYEAVDSPAPSAEAHEGAHSPAPSSEAEAFEGVELDAVRVLEWARAELGRLRTAAAREGELAGAVAGLAREREALQEDARRVAARLAAGRTRQEELSADAARLAARLDEARGGDETITARLTRLNDEAELLREAWEATRAAVVAEGERSRAAEAAEEAAREAGFADAADAEAAARGAAEREEKAETLRRLDAEHAAVTSTLEDPELVAAAARPAPDLAGLAAARDDAERVHTELASARDRAEARHARLRELKAELEGCVARWRPAADRHRLAERMASLASGTSSDNQWSMSLSSYVLGERLRQVADAANERLDHMSGGRYLLRHDLAKTAGSRARSGGGLGLRVYDGWTGVERDPATLSGGESFITSLALALGLADVVTAEAGGAEIGTLFVDEGFGTLDEDTLDGVLDILDGLRDGGRAVGIISHVAELRTRIPAQLRVAKTRTGSTLSVVGG